MIDLKAALGFCTTRVVRYWFERKNVTISLAELASVK